MSNKVLSASVIVLLLLAAGIVVATRQKQGNDRENAADQYSYNTDSGDASKTGSSLVVNDAPADPNQTQGSVLGQQLNGCQRNFSEEKLEKETVSTAGRKVEMQVRNFGTIILEFYDKDAPKTVENFLRLANAGYYDCLIFHRVVKGFVIQSGDPTGTGRGGQSAFGSEFADELNPKAKSYQDGYKQYVLAMANRGSNTNTSQFFILLNDAPSLPKNYTIFGRVTAGQDVIDKIGKVDIIPVSPIDPNEGAPEEDVVIESVKIIK